jgi:selenocysteine lyase/cysteine desulfurase
VAALNAPNTLHPALQARKRFGVRVEVIPETPAADLDIAQLEAMLQQQVCSWRCWGQHGWQHERCTVTSAPPLLRAPRLLLQQPKPVLVAISHVPTSSGRVNDATAVGAAAAAAGVPFLLDACQSAGQMPLDVQALRCDFLTGW